MLEGCVPWPADFARLYRERGYWQGRTIGDLIEVHAKAEPDREAVVEGNRRLTFGQFWEASGRLAAGLIELGFKPLDRVVYQIPNSCEYLIGFLALMRIGVIPVLALPQHRRNEIEHFVRASKSVGLFIPDVHRNFDYRVMAEEIRPKAPTLRNVLVLGEPWAGQVSLGGLLAKPTDPGEVERAVAPLKPSPSEVAIMLLSGGTTALSKLIPRTHDDYTYNITVGGPVVAFDRDTVFLAMLPFGHNATLGSAGILCALANGGKVVISTPDPETAFPVMEREGVTFTLLAPPLAVAWLNSPILDNYDLSSIRNLLCGGARLAPEQRLKLGERLKCTVQEGYGNGEGLICYVGLEDPLELRMESSGAPISPADEIKVVDEFDRELPDGEVGELLARGPYTIRGYYDNPETNAKSFTADGFYRTGDLVFKRGRHVFHQGRKKELINRGGEKISCAEIEDLILTHPAIENAVVVGMPDPVFGEKACVFAILKPDQSLTLPELTDYLLRLEIAKFKLPERLEVVDSFPISPAGKVLRRELREQIAAKIRV